FCPASGKIDPISRSIVDPHFRYAATPGRLYIAKMTLRRPRDPRINPRERPCIP
ncbi:MAG: hypothetical protein RL367_2096, partial [Pseudomonadota bacterium]